MYTTDGREHPPRRPRSLAQGSAHRRSSRAHTLRRRARTRRLATADMSPPLDPETEQWPQLGKKVHKWIPDPWIPGPGPKRTVTGLRAGPRLRSTRPPSRTPCTSPSWQSGEACCPTELRRVLDVHRLFGTRAQCRPFLLCPRPAATLVENGRFRPFLIRA